MAPGAPWSGKRCMNARFRRPYASDHRAWWPLRVPGESDHVFFPSWPRNGRITAGLDQRWTGAGDASRHERRYRLTQAERFAEMSDVRLTWKPRPHYNIAPTQKVAVML